MKAMKKGSTNAKEKQLTGFNVNRFSLVIIIPLIVALFSFKYYYGSVTSSYQSSLINQSIAGDIPYPLPYYSNLLLPDPFTSQISKKRAETVAQFRQLQKEQSSLFQAVEFGPNPGKPEKLSGLIIDNNTLVIKAEHGDNSITYNVTIVYPKEKEGGMGPWPAMIAYSGANIPTISQLDNVAFLMYNNSEMAHQLEQFESRGKGLFYDLYGHSYPASGLMAMAWGASRIIDVLEMLPEANIIASRIGVTGCSRNGKGAMVAGAYDKRIALTIPQESGAGGSVCWRLADYEAFVLGEFVQTATQIVTENVWLSTSFERFANSTSELMVDHHILAGLIAPRGLLVFDNSLYSWLGYWSSYGCMSVARLIYDALGASQNIGYYQSNEHEHCQFSTVNEQAILQAFNKKFLLNNTEEESDSFVPVFEAVENIDFDIKKWIDWDTPRFVDQ